MGFDFNSILDNDINNELKKFRVIICLSNMEKYFEYLFGYFI